MRTHRPKHLTTFDYRGRHRYFLTFCTHGRTRLFANANAVTLVRTQIERAATEQQFALIAYGFMPDHLHALVEGSTTDADGLVFIARAKQYSGFHYRKSFEARLWQRYGFERVLRNEEDTVPVVRYIVENPVRARIAQRIDEYPFSGSSVYTFEQLLDAVQLQRGWCRSG